MKDENPLKSALKPFLPIKLRQELANYVRVKNFKKHVFPQDVKRMLANEFRGDVLELQDLIQRDLSGWLNL